MASDRLSLDDLIRHIDAVVGPPESETPEDRERRYEMVRRDQERRRKRKQILA